MPREPGMASAENVQDVRYAAIARDGVSGECTGCTVRLVRQDAARDAVGKHIFPE